MKNEISATGNTYIINDNGDGNFTITSGSFPSETLISTHDSLEVAEEVRSTYYAGDKAYVESH